MQMNADRYQISWQSHQSGFTVVETLVAIVVVSLLMAAIAPVIVLSVGNRVQARRVELATQAAKTYIDGIRTGAIAPPSHTVELEEVDAYGNFASQRIQFASEAPPSTTAGLTCLPNQEIYPYCWQTPTASLFCIDLDERDGCSQDSARDLVVQAFRSISPVSADAGKGYLLGVRVYRADAFSDNAPMTSSDPENKRTQTPFTGGMGDRKAPLVETTTEIISRKAALPDLCDRLGGCY